MKVSGDHIIPWVETETLGGRGCKPSRGNLPSYDVERGGVGWGGVGLGLHIPLMFTSLESDLSCGMFYKTLSQFFERLFVLPAGYCVAIVVNQLPLLSAAGSLSSNSTSLQDLEALVRPQPIWIPPSRNTH